MEKMNPNRNGVLEKMSNKEIRRRIHIKKEENKDYTRDVRMNHF